MWGTSCGGSKSGEIKPGDNFSSVGRGKQKQKYACYNFEYISFSHCPGCPRKTRNLSPVDSCQSWAAGYGEGAWGEKKSGQVCYSTCSTSLTSKHLVPQRSLSSRSRRAWGMEEEREATWLAPVTGRDIVRRGRFWGTWGGRVKMWTFDLNKIFWQQLCEWYAKELSTHHSGTVESAWQTLLSDFWKKQTLLSVFWRMGGPPTNPSQQPTSPQGLSPMSRGQVVKYPLIFSSNSKSIGEHWRSDNRHAKPPSWPLESPCAASPRQLAARRGCQASPGGGSWWWRSRSESWSRSGGGESSHDDAHGELWPNRPFIQESSPGKDVDFAVRRSSWEDGLHCGVSSILMRKHCVTWYRSAIKLLEKACNWQVWLSDLHYRA